MGKRYILQILLVGIGLTFDANAFLRASSGGQVNFSGSLLSMTCSLGVGEGGSNTVIQLPTISASALASAGATAGRTNVQISMSGCPAIESVSAYFQQGADVDPATGRLINSLTPDAGGATGVQLQLRDANGGGNSIIKIGSTTQTDEAVGVPIVDGMAQLSYTVEYVTPTGDVTPGDFSSRVEYVITYQ